VPFLGPEDDAALREAALRRSGRVLSKGTHQGIGNHSSWARGQAWGLYGYTSEWRARERSDILFAACFLYPLLTLFFLLLPFSYPSPLTLPSLQ
jgi:hypothetical protein